MLRYAQCLYERGIYLKLKFMTRLFDLLYYQLKNHPIPNAINGRDSANNWKSYSSQQVVDASEKAAAGLIGLGLKPGDKVAIVVYKNRPEWLIIDFAIQMAGLISIPLYPTISVKEYAYILNETEVKIAFCGSGDLFDKLSASKEQVASLKTIFTFDEVPNKPFWETIFSTDFKQELAQTKARITEENLVTIIYTSGTTGNPKGAMLTHTNIMHVVKNVAPEMAVTEGDHVLSFLPLCHIFERSASFAYYYKGCKTFFVGTDNLSGSNGDLLAVQPVSFTAVPRLLEKIYEAIYNKGLALDGIKKKLFFWSLELTNHFELDQKSSWFKQLKLSIADTLVYSKWRKALGGKVKAIVTGAAPCPVKILRVFCAAGIPIREGYGLTETSPTLTLNTLKPYGAMFGSAGPTIDGVELFIDQESGKYKEDEGEILAYGPNVMLGYYKKPDINAQVFREIDKKRWFCTGDIGKIVKGPKGTNFLKITDRKKELLKTTGGKYVAPAPIENRIREAFLVAQIMVIGDQQKFVSALIVPAEEALKNYCAKKKIFTTSLEQLATHKKIIKRFQKIIDRCNPEFSHVEQIKKFRLVMSPWLPFHEDGSAAELTPTFKLKRRVILQKYKAEIASIYEK